MTQATVKIDIEAAAEAVGVRPETSVRLMQLAGDENADPADLNGVIDADPNMTMRTLKLANSAFYGMPTRVSRIDRAVALLGVSTVAKLAASSSVDAAFKSIKIDAPGLTADTPRRYSLSVALATEVIAKATPTTASVAARKLSAEAFVTGLIHDIGAVVQAKLHADAFSQAVNASQKTGIPMITHERRTIGIDHAQIGMQLAEHWKLPPELVQGIGFHHDPQAADPHHRPLACIIHVALQLTRRAGVASLDGDTDMPLLENALTFLRLDPRQADKLTNEIQARLRNAPI